MPSLLYRKGVICMSLVDLITVIAGAATFFALGYTIGYNHKEHTKDDRPSHR